jgi:hypothetical protein
MFQNSSLPRVVRVKSTTPINDDLEVFDMMSRFLASEKAKQLSHDFAGQAYLASASQLWNDLRQTCNSLLERNDPRREPVAAWKEQIEEVAEALAIPMKTEDATESAGVKSEPDTAEGSSEKKSKKKKKRKSESIDDDDGDNSEKESARRRRKAEKKEKKEKKHARKEKNSSKKAKADTLS